jgi:hypothetical protein
MGRLRAAQRQACKEEVRAIMGVVGKACTARFRRAAARRASRRWWK